MVYLGYYLNIRTYQVIYLTHIWYIISYMLHTLFLHTFWWTVGGHNKCMLFTFVPKLWPIIVWYTPYFSLSYKLIHIMTINDTMRTKGNVVTDSNVYEIILVNRFHMNWYNFLPYTCTCMTSWTWFCLMFELTSTWPNFTFPQSYLYIGANNYQKRLPKGYTSEFGQWIVNCGI